MGVQTRLSPLSTSTVPLLPRVGQEEGALVVTMNDFSEGVPAAGLAQLPPRSARRRRIQLLPGSASILQPYPCTAGDTLAGSCAPCTFPCGVGEAWRQSVP